MNISRVDSKTRVSLAKPININIGDDINRWTCSSVSENSLEIRLNAHVWWFIAIENLSSGIFRKCPVRVLGDPGISCHASLHQ